MKDGDITDQGPDRRNNDIAEMREAGWGEGQDGGGAKEGGSKAEGAGRQDGL